MPAIKPALLTVVTAGVASSGMPLSWQSVGVYSNPVPAPFSTAVEGCEPNITVKISGIDSSAEMSERNFVDFAPKEWTKSLSRKFQNLAALDALDEATEEQKAELKKLADIRRVLVAPRTGAEIIADYALRRQTQKVIGVLDEYFQLFRIHATGNS